MKLQLSLKKQWFDMTKSGIKTEDYREITPYWVKRLMQESYLRICSNDDDLVDYIVFNIDVNFMLKHHAKKFKTNTMTLGYPKSTDLERILKLEHKGIEIRTGNSDWGAEPDKLYFVVLHGSVLAK